MTSLPRSLRLALRQLLLDFGARLIRWTLLGRTSPSGFDQVDGREVDPSEPLVCHGARRLQHYGFRSRPPAGSEVLVLAPGGATSQKVYIASEAPGTGPSSQAEAEVELYAKPGQRVTLDKDGQITISAHGATIQITSAGDVLISAEAAHAVKVNGGGADVATVGSSVNCGSLSVVPSMGGVAQVLWTDPDNVVSTVVPNFPDRLTLTGRVTSGSARFKAPAP